MNTVLEEKSTRPVIGTEPSSDSPDWSNHKVLVAKYFLFGMVMLAVWWGVYGHLSAGNVLAAMLGVVTPFCSCSAVPLFLGFVTTGVPLGVTFSFLISAPMVNEIALVLLYVLFGWQVAAIYLSTGLLIAMVAGWIIGRLRMERHLEDWVHQIQVGENNYSDPQKDWVGRIRYGLEAVRDIVGKVWIYVLLGIAVGAGIHGYVPQGVMASFMGKSAWWSVPLSVLIGISMYSNATGWSRS